MTGLFDEREHAAENLFAHEEELRFLAHRRAILSLGAWAAECMGLSAEAGRHYEAGLVDALVAGTLEERIVAEVQTDLERAGKPALSTTVGTVLSQAIAQATDELQGRAKPRPKDVAVRARHAGTLNAALGWRD